MGSMLYLCEKYKQLKEEDIDWRPKAMISDWDHCQQRFKVTVPFWHERERAMAEIPMHRIQEQKRLIQNMICGSNECEKTGADVGLKVCQQCKIMYYCSRRCQKKAW